MEKKIIINMGRLNARQTRALKLCAECLSGAMPEDREDILQVFGLLGPVNGSCIPMNYAGDDVTDQVRKKFMAILFPAVELASEELGLSYSIRPRHIIDASLDGETWYAVIDYDGPFCYYSGNDKAWYFTFKSLSEVANMILKISAQIVKKHRELNK